MGVDVGVGLGVPLGVGVVVAVAVGVDVAVGVGVSAGVEVGVDVAVAVAVAVGVGVSEGPCTSKEPTSMRPFTTRSKPEPRWSNNGGGVKFGSPASIAGLPANGKCVTVGPPLSCNGPSIGLVKSWSPGPVKKPPASSLLILYPSDVTVPPPLT